MVDYDKPVGSAGTMRIRDTGSTVEFWILCSDGATNVGGYTWSGVVNGVGVGGTTSLPSGFGSRLLGSWSVSTTQTVTFHQNATGTSGLGGAADHSANINRTPPATVPGVPTTLSLTPISAVDVRIQFAANGSGGSPITGYDIQLSPDPAFGSGIRNYFAPGSSSGIETLGGLVPVARYYARVRANNALGSSGWSGQTVSARLWGGVQVSNGTTNTTYAVEVSDGTSWRRQIVDLSDGATWKTSA